MNYKSILLFLFATTMPSSSSARETFRLEGFGDGGNDMECTCYVKAAPMQSDGSHYEETPDRTGVRIAVSVTCALSALAILFLCVKASHWNDAEEEERKAREQQGNEDTNAQQSPPRAQVLEQSSGSTRVADV